MIAIDRVLKAINQFERNDADIDREQINDDGMAKSKHILGDRCR